MSDAKFVRHSLLDILVPEVTDLDIEEALQASAETVREDDSITSTIQQRNLLYFDEDLALYAILRTPYEDLLSLKGHIARLAIIIEAHAISSPAVNNDGGPPTTGAQARDVIWSSRLDVSEDPIIVVEGSDEDDEQDALLIWKMNAFLSRPRVRLQAPAIIFKVSASLQPAPVGNTKAVEEYLPSGVPFPINVLEPLSDVSGSSGRQLHLPASRLSRVVPSSAPSASEVLPLKVVSRRAFRAIPAISSRMRYHRSNDSTSRSTIMGSLELDVPVFAQHPIELSAISVKFSTGEEQQMIRGQSLDIPTVCNARDSVACIYALTQPPGSSAPNGQSPTMKSLDIMVDARVQASTECRPRIRIRWKQNIDFATALNAKFNRVRGSIHRSNRPRSLSTNTNGTAPAPAGDTRHFANDDMGLSATITGKDGVYVGKPFKWNLFIINKSTKQRQFIVAVLPKRRPGDGKRGSSRPTSTQHLPAARGGVLADAVVDENVLYTVIKSQGADMTPMVSLSSDVRTGQLAPGSCFSTDLEMLPLAKGPQHIDSIRVIDAESNEAVDIRDLPDIMVGEADEAEA